MTASSADEVRPGLEDMAELADALVAEIAAARAQCDELRAVLDESEAAADEPPVPDDPAAAEPAAPAPGEPRQHAGEAEDGSPEPPPLERARLGALSLALTGGSREQTRDHLRDAFGVTDCDDILDEVFGNFPDPDPEPVVAPKRRLGRLRRGR
jgi:hypothetical protein